MYSVLDRLSEYTYIYISKNITLYTFVALFLKSLKAFNVSLTRQVYDFSVEYNCIDVSDIIDIHKYLMKIHDIK